MFSLSRTRASVLRPSLAFASLALCASQAFAQQAEDPIPPDVMILLDTSGSMEDLIDDARQPLLNAPDPTRAAALPTCLCGPNDLTCNPPAPGTGVPVNKAINRWGTLVQSFTGTVKPYFACAATPRTRLLQSGIVPAVKHVTSEALLLDSSAGVRLRCVSVLAGTWLLPQGGLCARGLVRVCARSVRHIMPFHSLQLGWGLWWVGLAKCRGCIPPTSNPGERWMGRDGSCDAVCLRVWLQLKGCALAVGSLYSHAALCWSIWRAMSPH